MLHFCNKIVCTGFRFSRKIKAKDEQLKGEKKMHTEKIALSIVFLLSFTITIVTIRQRTLNEDQTSNVALMSALMNLIVTWYLF